MWSGGSKKGLNGFISHINSCLKSTCFTNYLYFEILWGKAIINTHIITHLPPPPPIHTHAHNYYYGLGTPPQYWLHGYGLALSLQDVQQFYKHIYGFSIVVPFNLPWSAPQNSTTTRYLRYSLGRLMVFFLPGSWEQTSPTPGACGDTGTTQTSDTTSAGEGVEHRALTATAALGGPSDWGLWRGREQWTLHVDLV